MHDSELYLVAFFLKKIAPVETNYIIYNKELLVIIQAFKIWRLELTSVTPEGPIKVLLDHYNLEYFITTKQLNHWQAR
jgi:hypothetical protein